MEAQIVLTGGVFVGAIALMMSLGAAEYVEVEGIDAFEEGVETPQTAVADLEDDALEHNNVEFLNYSEVPEDSRQVSWVNNADDVVNEVDKAVKLDDETQNGSVTYPVGGFNELYVLSTDITFQSNDLNFVFDDADQTQVSASGVIDLEVPPDASVVTVEFPQDRENSYLFYLETVTEDDDLGLRTFLRSMIQIMTLRAEQQWFNLLVGVPLLLTFMYIFAKIARDLVPLT